MNILLPFDLETTGLYKKSLPLNDPAQPHLVSCSALQVRPDDLFIQQSMSKIVHPSDWEWDDTESSEDRAFQVHQLTVDYCAAFGRSEKEVLDELIQLWDISSDCTIIAHNLNFDRNIIACAIARYYGSGSLLNSWLAAPGFCTMKESKNIIKAQTKPNAKGATRLKNPNLKEAYKFFTGEELSNHHSANRDAVACLQIWVGLEEYNND